MVAVSLLPCQSDVKADGARARSRAHHLGIDALFRASRQANPHHRAYIAWLIDVTLAREGRPPGGRRCAGAQRGSPTGGRRCAGRKGVHRPGADDAPGRKGAHRPGAEDAPGRQGSSSTGGRRCARAQRGSPTGGRRCAGRKGVHRPGATRRSVGLRPQAGARPRLAGASRDDVYVSVPEQGVTAESG